MISGVVAHLPQKFGPSDSRATFPLAMAPASIYGLVISFLAFLTIIFADQSEISPKKILIILPVPSQGHHSIFSSYINGLLERGHYITITTPRAQKTIHPRLREIIIKDPFNSFEKFSQNFYSRQQSTIEKTIQSDKIGALISSVIFESSKVLALKNETFDLVVTEPFIFQEPMLGFAHHFGCPALNLHPMIYTPLLNEYTGGTINPAYVPSMFGTAVEPETFLDRFKNSAALIFMMLYHRFYYLPRADARMRAVFPDAPPITELISNISLTLIANNNALMHPVPLAPSVIEIAGIHTKPGKPLPADLKKWIEDSKDGFVYFSLGSNLRADLLPEDKRRIIFASFGKLKQRVLIKWNGKGPNGAPENCRFEEWVSQQSVLSQPNLKVFVTHGGLLSVQESVYYGAAIIGIPLFADQFLNMEIATKRGFALQISLHDLTTDIFDAALNEVINSPKYCERSKDLSLRFRLDPIHPLEKAVYYTEQLIKLGSFDHLQPSSVKLRWYQYMLLDVAAVAAIALYITYRIMCCGLSMHLYFYSKLSKPKSD